HLASPAPARPFDLTEASPPPPSARPPEASQERPTPRPAPVPAAGPPPMLLPPPTPPPWPRPCARPTVARPRRSTLRNTKRNILTNRSFMIIPPEVSIYCCQVFETSGVQRFRGAQSDVRQKHRCKPTLFALHVQWKRQNIPISQPSCN